MRASDPTSDFDGEDDRICRALFDLSVSEGYRNVTVAQLLARAGVDDAAFGRHFTDLEDCLFAVLSKHTEAFLAAVADAYISESEWLAQMRAVAYAILDFIDRDHDRARFLFVEGPFGGERAQLNRDNGLEAMYELIDRGRLELADPESFSRSTAEAIAGTVFNRIHAAILKGDLSVGRQMVPELMYTVVLPYLGREVALAELSIEPPPSPDPPGPEEGGQPSVRSR